ncbi:hypothetical protein MSS4_03105 [Mycobacterium marinum]|nr:hypothetical protein MSS4_03105 [Mycobacterium marinum]
MRRHAQTGVERTRDRVPQVGQARLQRAHILRTRISGTEIHQARGVIAEIAEPRDATVAGIEKARRRARRRVPETWRRRDIDDRDLGRPQGPADTDVDRGGWTTDVSGQRWSGYPNRRKDYWADVADVYGSEDIDVEWEFGNSDPRGVDVTNRAIDRYIDRNAYFGVAWGFGDVDRVGEADQSLVVAAPEGAVAVVAGDKRTGVNVAAVARPVL